MPNPEPIAPTARAAKEARSYETLLRLWRWHRLQFLLMGEGSTASMNDSHHSVPDSRPPKDAAQEIRELEGRWACCCDNDDRRAVIRDTQAMLRNLKFPRADPRTIRDTQEWRLAIATDERPAALVARFYGVSRRTVFNYRSEFKAERHKAAA